MNQLIAPIQEIGREVLDCADPARVFDADIYDEMGESDIEDALYKLFLHANVITADAGIDPPKANNALARKMLEMASHPDVISSIGASVAGTCFQAELRLARSLTRDSQGKAAPNRLPSAILFDEESKPYAYQKADGYPTAYAWRDAYVETTRGRAWVPEGCIIEVVYGNQQKNRVYTADPRNKYRGEGLVMLEGSTIPDEVRLKRVGAEYLPDLLRTAGADLAIMDVPSLAPYRDMAVTLNAGTIASRLNTLLGQRQQKCSE